MTLNRRKIKIAVILALVAALYIGVQLFMPLKDAGTSVEVEVPHGATFRQAVRALSEKGLVRDTNLFVIMGRLSGLHRKLRPGLYVFEGQQSTWSVFTTLTRGKVELWTVTIAEGENLWRIRDKFEEKGIMNAALFDSLTNDPELMARLGVNAPSLEGYLYPETYLLARGMEPEKVISTMVRKMKSATTPLLEKAAGIGFSENQLLTMASIVEKEAILDEERPIISAVYHNRLRQGIRLQADPTVIYGIKQLGEGITLSDLKRETPYNTYIIKGLPPGPIASPGIKSIQAALEPENVPYIFFVSNNDGSHVFTTTLKEHQRAVKAYRVGRSLKNRKRNGDDG